MKSSSAKKVVAIYSIVFATLSLLGTFTETPDVLEIIIVITMLISGIILLIPELKKVEKPLMITLLVVYSVFVLVGLIYFFIIPLIGLIVFGMVGVPFIFAIVFLSLKAKEDNHVTSQSSNPPFFLVVRIGHLRLIIFLLPLLRISAIQNSPRITKC